MELQQNYETIRSLGAEVVGVSVDPLSQSTALVRQLSIAYPLVEDVNHRLGSAFGVFRLPNTGMDMGPVDNHSVFILDEKSVVRWKQLAPTAMYVPQGEILAALRALGQ